MLAKLNVAAFISESFALNLYHYSGKKNNFFCFSLKFRAYSFSAVNAVSCNSCAGTLPKIEISFFSFQYAQMNS